MQPSGPGEDPPEERVRQDLSRLGSDAASAPQVPATVTARIGAALRSAPTPAVHAVTGASPRLRRPQVIAALIGLCAALTAIVLGALALLHTKPAPRFPVGPTADRITVSMSSMSPVPAAPSHSGITPR